MFSGCLWCLFTRILPRSPHQRFEHFAAFLPSLPGRIHIGSRPSLPKPVRSTRWLRNAMGTLAERALLAAVRHVAESASKWTDGRVTDREEPHAWNRITMTNRRLTCRLASHRIELWCIQVVCGPRPVFKDSATESDEPWYDSENPPHDTSSSDSESPNWYDTKTGLHRW